MRFVSLCAAAAVLLAAGTASAQYVERWDSTHREEHNWVWDSASLGVWQPMAWAPTGGPDNSGHVATDIGDLAGDFFIPGDSFPAWIMADAGGGQEIDLAGQSVRIDLKLDAGSTLGGGTIHFYVQKAGTYYYHLTPLAPGAETWTTASLAVGGDTDWADLFVPDPSVLPSDLFDDPDEYGFILLRDGDEPAGRLRFDNFAVPEPVTLALLALGAAGLLGRRLR